MIRLAWLSRAWGQWPGYLISNIRSPGAGEPIVRAYAGHRWTVADTSGRGSLVSPALMHVHGPYCQTPALHLYRTVIRSKA
jgi:hypothetical protein